VKGLEVAVEDDCHSEGGVLAAVLGDAAGGGVADGAEEGDGLLGLHRVSPFARSIGTHPYGRAGALLPSRGMAALPREQVFGKGPGACEGGGVRNREGAVREF
jgi:hypothetical protein